MKTVIIKYNAGNVQSVAFALERLGLEHTLSDHPEEILSADRVIFPGVGEASSAMNYLKSKQLDNLIPRLTQPVLGICLGMQLLCEFSEEGSTPCMGIFPAQVKKFSADSTGTNPIKVPQIGWNTIEHNGCKLFSHVPDKTYLYFVHSYYASLCSETVATSNYGSKYSSALQKNNFYAVQFHPEKSADAGQQIIKNFIELT